LTQTSTKGRPERISLWVGIFSGVIGLISGIFGLPGPLENALGRGDLKKLELQQKQAALRDAAPRLDVSYLFLHGDHALLRMNKPPTSKARLSTSAKATTLLDFPVAENDVPTDPDMNEVGCRIKNYRGSSQTFLVVQNGGKRDATGITLYADQLRLAAPVRVNHTAGDDYVAKLRAAARSIKSVTFAIPHPLAPGEGVLLPLWITVTPQNRSNPWCVASRTTLLPTSIRFVDPGLDASTTTDVRPRFANPEILDYGITLGN
jgi:hypothetical protein